jgi:hypothetical protein
MKKFFFSALLALTASGLATVPSFAGVFGLIPGCGCCCAKVCCRQYNAFSPFCCDCCCPSGGGCGAPCGPGPAMYGDCGPCADGMCGDGMCSGGLNFPGSSSCPSGGCADGACLGSLPAGDPGAAVAPGGITPPASNPVMGPSPLPGSMPAGPTSQAMYPQVIQNTAYRPAAVPAPNYYTPARMQPQQMAAPSYWGN